MYSAATAVSQACAGASIASIVDRAQIRRGFASGVLAIAVGGCGASHPAKASKPPPAAAPTSTSTPTPTPGTVAARPVAPPSHLGPARSYAGSGGRSLGLIALTGDAVLHWTGRPSPFSVSAAGPRVLLSGTGPRAQGFAGAGDYKDVRVSAVGTWRLQIQLLGTPP